MSGEVAFEQAWKDVAGQVSARCGQLARDSHEAQELYQLVAIRAWRGHATFRGDAAYLTWVIRILDREAARLANKRNRTESREISVNLQAANDQFHAYSNTAHSPESYGGAADYGTGSPGGAASSGGIGSSGRTDAAWLATVLAHAAAAAAISEAEHRVVSERLAHPDEPWSRIASRLGMTATACAVAHSRAVPKLRVFLFTGYRSLIGGDQAVTEAFDRLRRDPSAALTVLEAEAFEQVVIHRSAGYRRRGSQAALRGACAKVALRMGLP